MLHYVASPPDAFDAVREDLEEVCAQSGGSLSLEIIWVAIVEHRAQLWLIIDGDDCAGIVVTEFAPGRLNVSALRVRPRWARSEVFADTMAWLDRSARELKVELTCWSARPGMARHLARLGWKPRLVEYVAPKEK